MTYAGWIGGWLALSHSLPFELFRLKLVKYCEYNGSITFNKNTPQSSI
jgi:hypothetical protein